jgi:S-adenosylhomocysteine hydrolase
MQRMQGPTTDPHMILHNRTLALDAGKDRKLYVDKEERKEEPLEQGEGEVRGQQAELCEPSQTGVARNRDMDGQAVGTLHERLWSVC